jgi:hypothetical protein
MLLRFLGTSKGSEDVEEVLSLSEARRKNGTDEEVGTTTERRCKAAVALERTPSGEEDAKLGEVARVSDFKPESFVGVGADSGVGSSPVTSLSGLSESGRRVRPAGRWRAGEGETVTAAGKDNALAGDMVGSSSSSSSSTRVWS